MSEKTLNDYSLFQALLGGYLPTDQETNDGDGDIKYYGYQNKHGEWYIMKEDLSPAGGTEPITWTYARGDSDYGTNWTGRQALTYTRPAVAFK